MSQFGRTWWGNLWLDALLDIDYSNRLPRGRTYAKPHRVLSLAIDKRTVKAKVQGRTRTPYRVELSLKALSKPEKQRLLNSIKGDPHAIGKLLNGNLPPQIYNLAIADSIELLPTSWQSMKGRCSCPDWAVPCKHLAAVVYLLANEIDKDPFLIFKLRGMDLLAEIQSVSGLELNLEKITPNPFLVLKDQSEDIADQGSCLELLEMDLSVVPELGDRVFELLTPNPLFYKKDFRVALENQYKRNAKWVGKFESSSEDDLIQIRDFPGKSLIVSDQGKFQCTIDSDGSVSHESAEHWVDELSRTRSLGLNAVNDGDAHAVFWYVLYKLAILLLNRKAYVPQVHVFTPKEAILGWRAATLDGSVTEVLERMFEVCPSDLVFIQSKAGKSTRKHLLSRKSQVNAALNVLLTYFINETYTSRSSASTDDSIQKWFFTGSISNFQWFGEADTPVIVQRWLNCLTLRDRAHQILLIVEDDDDEYEDEEPTEVLESVTTDVQISLDLKIQIKDRIYSLVDTLSNQELGVDSINILSDVSFLSTYLVDLEHFLTRGISGRQPKIEYSLTEFAPILLNSLPVLELLGVKLVLPKSLNKLLRPQLNLKVTSTGNSSGQTFLDLNQLMSFDWQVALGDNNLSAEEFLQLVKSVSGLVRIRDQYVLLDSDEVESIAKRIEKLPETLSSLEMLQGHLTESFDEASIEFDSSIKEILDKTTRYGPLAKPKHLNAVLREYQHSGFEWLAHNARMGFGSILADDMGLGKTVQVIALLLHQKELGELDNSSALAIVPTSLITNWKKELERFASSLSVYIYYGTNRKLPTEHHDVILASYGVARGDVQKLSKKKFRTLIVDEAQTIKNPSAQQTKAIKQIKADVRIALSGTPVENRLLDYWSIFDFTMRGYLGTKTAFQKKLAKPIEFERDQASLDKFRKLTSPFILRRLKTDKTIIKDLPDKIDSDRFCTLTEIQASLYQKTIDSLDESLAQADSAIQRSGYLFKLIMALKQICNAPSHYLKRAYPGPEESGKLALFVDILGEALEADEKVLVFTQFKQMGDILVDCLRSEFGLEAPFLHGGLSRKKRDEQVDSFQSDSRVRAMVLSLKAGGTGLNLTSANQVIHYDLWWNPAVETQATDRAYRIGQTRNVIVHRLLTENTFEERINEMLQSKRDLAEIAVTDGEVSITDMSDEQIRELVALS